MINYLWAAAGGAILTLAFAPFNLLPVAVLAIAILVYLLQEQSSFKAFKIGYVWGFGYNFSSLYWIANSLSADIEKFGWLYYPTILLIPAVLSIYYALMCFLYTLISNKFENDYIKPPIFAFAWLLQEIARENFYIAWPWNLLGYTFVSSTELSQSVTFLTVEGIGFIIALTAAAIIYCFKTGVLISSSIFALLFFYGSYKITSFEYKNSLPELEIIQPNFTNITYDPIYRKIQFVKVVNFIRKKSEKSLIILPEGIFPAALRKEEWIDFPQNLFLEDKIVVLGADIWHPKSDQHFNSIVVVENGVIKSYYHKQILVPFGEYFPGKGVFPQLFETVARGMGEFSQGSGNKIIQIGEKKAIASICYEGIFPRHFQYNKDDYKNKPDFILNISNDAWFGTGIGVHQHFAMLRMRAIETGLPIIRGTVNGISAIIDPLGRVIDSIPLRTENEKIETLYHHGKTSLIK